MNQVKMRSFHLYCFLLLLSLNHLTVSEAHENEDNDGFADLKQVNQRNPKVFQIIKFENSACVASPSRTGTCYTGDECRQKVCGSQGGNPVGNCAGGFGVCCVFDLSCGGRAAENCTYLVQDSLNSRNACPYTICKCSDDICRIRFDFLSFNIAPPVEGTTDTTGVSGAAIGDCVTDRFSITSPGNQGTPVICGFNTGQHMIVDASDACHVAKFDIGSANVNRQWEIKVTQYACGDENGGPDGCLQYFTGTSGRIASFNFPTNEDTVPLTTTHLSNQCYTMCFRRELNRCAICFAPTITATTVGTQDSFGLSLSGDDTAKAQLDGDCGSDYLSFPGAPMGMTSSTIERICGRIFGITGDLRSTETICTTRAPFRITFKTDDDEITDADNFQADQDEVALVPGGIIGFSLDFTQTEC